MTVCVAARSQGGLIFGASDRMLTSGDVQFEPNTSKIYPLTTSIAAMTAGDSAFQIEILREVHKILEDRMRSQPDNWWLLRDVAYLYLHYRNEIKKKRAEEILLVPLGLDLNSFVAKQKQMSDRFITQLTKELVNFEVPSVETIFAGVDQDGSHIYTVEHDRVSCHDSVGFSAIGIGYSPAKSQFMLTGYNYESPIADSLLLTYTAKRRAEVAPGVGRGTDMFVIGPNLGSYIRITEVVLDKLHETYTEMVKKEEKTLGEGRREIQQYVEAIRQAAEEAAAAQSQTTPKTD